MEKATPQYPLDVICTAVRAAGIAAFTRTAQEGAARMGFTQAQAVAAVCGLKRSHFYKSMTTHADHRVWQDVYRLPTPCGRAYIKVTLWPDSRVVIQFKEQ